MSKRDIGVHSERCKWLSWPVTSAVLLLTWLLLVGGFNSPAHWLMGTLLALLIPRLLHGWWHPVTSVHNWTALTVFVWRTLIDIVSGNIQVAKLALGPQDQLLPKLIEFECRLDNKIAIFMLMSAISLAPGSVATQYDKSTGRIQVHALHCTDEQALIESIRQRYETLLQQVFAC